MTAPNWPALEYEQWKQTCQTLHRWTQIVGKIRLSKSPWLNHSWHSTLYVTENGLTTSIIHDRESAFSIEFDFIAHVLRVVRSDGQQVAVPLASQSVASFFGACFSTLKELEIEAAIQATPNELPDATPFPEDHAHNTYDPKFANRFWTVLLQCDRLMKQFRSRFSGKASPVHFFWGGLDLAVTRFSGRSAPEHPGGVPHLSDLVTKEAYSDEVSSCGFWPGNESYPTAAFYSYAYPEPQGFKGAAVPSGAFYEQKLGEFILPYRVVREADSPDRLVLDFFQRTYEAAANLGKWDRTALEGSRYLKMLQSQASRGERIG
jgi:uncharacterized protein DUF5996